MGIGTLLVLLAIVLAVVSFFIDTYTERLLTASVILLAIGVLVGVSALGR